MSPLVPGLIGDEMAQLNPEPMGTFWSKKGED